MIKIYSPEDRKKQLLELCEALELFVSYLHKNPIEDAPIEKYENCLDEARRLYSITPMQDELSGLSRSIPKMFWLHKEWNPSIDRNFDGSYSVPDWFNEADAIHERVCNAASILRTVASTKILC